ncbi:unnamed protein product [Mycena citricolor]|uniref:Mediator of RNA polymerase II transcription subunit 12 n=1 Tax=Mycena citricolor TaxID=2018698 RepID=A0AAD2HT76_9AGAR|nr:unnamed protein product [Mycena citricolor]
MRDQRPALPLYESKPPAWLPKAHESGDLGYTGFYPPRPGKDEDVLTAENVRNGYTLPPPVTVDRFSAKEVVHEGIRTVSALSKLEELMNELFSRRASCLPPIPQSTFRMPSRVFLNDSKRNQWISDLGNNNFPLHKLGKSVPGGVKPPELFDLLQRNHVATHRAIWFLRVLGTAETAGLRNKPSYDPTQYSIEWTNVMTGHLKKQLTEIALPSAPRPGLNIKQTFKGVLAEQEGRDKWIGRFVYTIDLLRPSYSEGLLDSRTFLVWLVQQMSVSNLAQIAFLVRLTDEYLDAILKNRALARPLIDACLAKLNEIHVSSMHDFLGNTEVLLKIVLQRLCLSLPDAFVSPSMWLTHSQLLSDVLCEDVMDYHTEAHAIQNSQQIFQLLQENLEDIKRRNEAMLFINLPSNVSARLRTVVSDVQLLNSISSKTDMDAVAYFSTDLTDDAAFVEKLQMLLTWSVTPLQFGDHRPFAAVTIIRNWRNKIGDRATRRDFAGPDELIQDQLFDWLDASDVARDAQNLGPIVNLYGKLVKEDVFSYANYVQRLVARGEPGLLLTDVEGTRHRDFLRCIPIHHSTSSLTSQRKVILYGPRVRETPEDVHERQIRKEIRALLPDLFNNDMPPNFPITVSDLLLQCPSLLLAPRFEQSRVFRQWLLSIVQRRLVEVSQNHQRTTQPALVNWFSVCIELMTRTKCFHSALELIICALEHAATADLLTAVIDTLRQFICIWNCMNASPRIVDALYSAHQRWKKAGSGEFRALLNLLLEMDNDRYLDQEARDSIIADFGSLTQALRPFSDPRDGDCVPDVLPDILLLVNDAAENSAADLASNLWMKYRTSTHWAWKVWDNTVACIRQIPLIVGDPDKRRECAVRYGHFLTHVDQHVPKGLDDQVLQWLLGPGKNEIPTFDEDTWDILNVVFLHLSVHGALQTTTILRGLVYPSWQLAASAATAEEGLNRQVLLRSVNSLFQQLLLQEENPGQLDILDFQRIQTRRQAVYQEPYFLELVASIPLFVALENNINLHRSLKKDVESLRLALSRHEAFRQGAFRNLDAIREQFEQSLADGQNDEHRAKSVMSALRVLLSDSMDADTAELSSWPDVTSMLSPWKLAATSIQLQFLLRQMGRALSCEGTRAITQANLDKLILVIFHHQMSSEEAYFVAQMARGTEGAVAAKFINNGLKTVTGLLQDPTTKSLSESFERAGELLRVIAYVAEPLRSPGAQLPALDATIQGNFFQVLHDKFAEIERCLSQDEDSPELTQVAISLSRFLQFHLGFHFSWTPKIKELSVGLSGTILKLVILHGSGPLLDLGAYSLLIDTLYYLLDELAQNAKPSDAFDPFCYSPHVLPSDIPPDFPRQYRNQIQALLRHLAPTAIVSHLATAYPDASGALVPDAPVMNRPWEWTEHIGEPPAEDEGHPAVKNSGSLSLEFFGAHITGDRITTEHDPRIQANLRTFEDSLSVDSVFMRDFRESRVEPDPAPITRPKAADGLAGMIPAAAAAASGSKIPNPSARRVSPALSVVSRSSAAHASVRPSPGQSSLSMSTMGDAESSSRSSSRRPSLKRKASEDAQLSASAKRAKPKLPVPKPKAKKR